VKEGSALKCRARPLWCTYIGEWRTTFAKTYGIKVRCYEEDVFIFPLPIDAFDTLEVSEE
jgi:hypothetical protein